MAHSNIAFFVPHLGCPHRCTFCDQRTISGAPQPPAPAEIARVCAQAKQTVRDLSDTEIAFFGGSFTAIPRTQMCALLEAAQPFLGADGFAGIRISTRPDAIDASVLELLRGYGVTAIELGAQSLSDRVLQLNERGHTAADVIAASHLIRDAGFSLGLQMMVGLYGSTSADDLATGAQLLALQPDTVRIYPTVILRGTVLAQLYEAGQYRPFSPDTAISLCATLLTQFEAAGVRVIRCGLHASAEVEKAYIGGIYHPAFRELCDTRRYRRLLSALLTEDDAAAQPVVVYVHPACVGKAVGHRKSNLTYFSARGISLQIRPQQGVARFQCTRTVPEENSCF